MIWKQNIMSVVRTVLAVLLLASAVHAASINTTPLTSAQKNIETLGTDVTVALPLTAAGVTLYENNTADRRGAFHGGHRICAEKYRA